MWEHRQSEDHLRATAPGWTILRNSIYAEVLLAGADAALASGPHVTNEGDGRAPVSDTVLQLTGRPPRAASDVLAEALAARA
ncbi:MAG: hypothetical protein QOJ21_3810 [Solirubrobacteraceae bacterium]|jgi:uncharacterized protein YbjT (DUF2867 family)|nr:hypothetical protein [Solirubrobacteraceae bacterium]